MRLPSVSGKRQQQSADSKQWLPNEISLCSNPVSITQQLCDLGQVTESLQALLSLLICENGISMVLCLKRLQSR